jgi:hypothetical protein
VGFGLTLGHLVGSVRQEAAPATVGSEGGGGRPRRPQCRQVGGVGRPMHAHGRVQGVRVEPSAMLELEQGRQTVGRTGELRPAAMAGEEGRL